MDALNQFSDIDSERRFVNLFGESSPLCGGRASAAAQGARNPNCVQKLKNQLFGHFLSMKPMKKPYFT